VLSDGKCKDNARLAKDLITSASYHLLSVVQAENTVIKLHRIWGHKAHHAERT